MATARLARNQRAELGKVWDQALAALKRAARAAADDGAPGLYEALFGGLRRVKKKKAAREPVAQKGTTPVTQPVTPAPAVGSSPPVSTT